MVADEVVVPGSLASYTNEGWEIEIEPEVRNWLDNLSDRDYLVAEHAAERCSTRRPLCPSHTPDTWVTAYANSASAAATTATPSV